MVYGKAPDSTKSKGFKQADPNQLKIQDAVAATQDIRFQGQQGTEAIEARFGESVARIAENFMHNHDKNPSSKTIADGQFLAILLENTSVQERYDFVLSLENAALMHQFLELSRKLNDSGQVLKDREVYAFSKSLGRALAEKDYTLQEARRVAESFKDHFRFQSTLAAVIAEVYKSKEKQHLAKEMYKLKNQEELERFVKQHGLEKEYRDSLANVTFPASIEFTQITLAEVQTYHQQTGAALGKLDKAVIAAVNRQIARLKEEQLAKETEARARKKKKKSGKKLG